MSCEYAREYYRVPAEIGRRVVVNGRAGIIAADRRHYIGVSFDDDQPGVVCNCPAGDRSKQVVGSGWMLEPGRTECARLDQAIWKEWELRGNEFGRPLHILQLSNSEESLVRVSRTDGAVRSGE